MSDVDHDARRTRRRAVRSAGPPVDEPTTVSSAATARVSAAAPAVAESGAAEGAAGVTDTEAAAPAVSTKAETPEKTVALTKTAAATEKTVALTKIPPPGQADAPQATPITGQTAGSGGFAHPGPRSSGRGRRILVAVGGALLVAALVAGATISAFVVRSVDDRADRRTEYVQTAEQAILNLTTINADTAKEDIDRILSVASGQFKTEFDGRVDPFLSIVQQAEVRASGEIIEAALESDDENSAKVLVAAKQTLTNAGQEGPQTRYYRFRVTVSESDSGLKASNVEFVP